MRFIHVVAGLVTLLGLGASLALGAGAGSDLGARLGLRGGTARPAVVSGPIPYLDDCYHVVGPVGPGVTICQP